MTNATNATPNNQLCWHKLSYKLMILDATDTQGVHARLYTLNEFLPPKYNHTIPMDYNYPTMLDVALRELRTRNNIYCADNGYTNTNEILLKLSPTQYVMTFTNRANWA